MKKIFQIRISITLWLIPLMIVFFIWYFKHKYNVNDNMQKLSFRIILTNYRIIKLRPIALNIRLLPGFLSSLFIYIFFGSPNGN